MRTTILFGFLALILSIGCGSVSERTTALEPCVEAPRTAECSAAHPGFVAMCYDDAEVGPPPVQADGDTCGALPDHNTVGPTPTFWFNWYCCDRLTCQPGVEEPCSCAGGAVGRRWCNGSGLRLGACVCD